MMIKVMKTKPSIVVPMKDEKKVDTRANKDNTPSNFALVLLKGNAATFIVNST